MIKLSDILQEDWQLEDSAEEPCDSRLERLSRAIDAAEELEAERDALLAQNAALREALDKRQSCACCGDDSRRVDSYVERRKKALKNDPDPGDYVAIKADVVREVRAQLNIAYGVISLLLKRYGHILPKDTVEHYRELGVGDMVRSPIIKAAALLPNPDAPEPEEGGGA